MVSVRASFDPLLARTDAFRRAEAARQNLTMHMRRFARLANI